MKSVVLLCDGMADTPCPELGGRTPMEAARKPAMDALAAVSEIGLVRTVPDGMAPGSDVANLTMMGYDTRACYTGRSPLEAANIGIDLADDDVAFRCNLVTLSDDPVFADKTILDYCAGDIHTREADELVRAVQEAFGGGDTPAPLTATAWSGTGAKRSWGPSPRPTISPAGSSAAICLGIPTPPRCWT